MTQAMSGGLRVHAKKTNPSPHRTQSVGRRVPAQITIKRNRESVSTSQKRSTLQGADNNTRKLAQRSILQKSFCDFVEIGSWTRKSRTRGKFHRLSLAPALWAFAVLKNYSCFVHIILSRVGMCITKVNQHATSNIFSRDNARSMSSRSSP